MSSSLRHFRPKVKPNIQAMQIQLTNFEEIAEWVEGNATNDGIRINHDQLCITFDTPNGKVTAGYNWWVARGRNGNFYPINPTTIRKNYEEIDESVL